MRDAWILVTCVAGQPSFSHPNLRIVLEPGASFLTTGLQPFSHEPQAGPYAYRMVEFFIQGLEQVRNSLLAVALPLRVPPVPGADVEQLWAGLLEACGPRFLPENDDAHIAGSALLSLLLRRLLGVALQTRPDADVLRGPDWLARLHDLVGRRSVSMPYRVSELAQELGLDPGYLGQAFHRHSGTTLVAWLRRRRLLVAQTMLRSTDEIPVGEVARRCGFADASRLARAFGKEFGCSPRAWRQGGDLVEAASSSPPPVED